LIPSFFPPYVKPFNLDVVDDFVMIKSIAEGDKVKAEIEHILYKPQIEYIRHQGLW